MPWFGNFEQSLQSSRVRRYRRIEVEVARFLDDLFGGLVNGHGSEREHARGTEDQIGQCTSGMRKDDLAAGGVAERVVDYQTHGRAAGLVRVVVHGLGKRGMDETSIHGRGGMDEDNGLSLAELGPNGLEIFMSEVLKTVTIACKQNHAVRLQLVEGVGDLFERGFRVKE